MKKIVLMLYILTLFFASAVCAKDIFSQEP